MRKGRRNILGKRKALEREKDDMFDMSGSHGIVWLGHSRGDRSGEVKLERRAGV